MATFSDRNIGGIASIQKLRNHSRQSSSDEEMGKEEIYSMLQVFGRELNKRTELEQDKYQGKQTEELYFEDEEKDIDRSFENARQELIGDIDNEYTESEEFSK